MTAFERQVYAAVYAAEVTRKMFDPPAGVFAPPRDETGYTNDEARARAWDAYEIQCNVWAAERATAVLARLRDDMPHHMRTGFEGTDTWTDFFQATQG